MWSSAILSNPRARVYNLRVLIIGALVAVGFTLDSVTKDSASLGAGCLILAHHPLALFASHLRLAAVDLLVTALEIIRNSSFALSTKCSHFYHFA
ncbi:hypothetical protein DFH06DRAFT_1214606 [Mycena polygramma]|nr:hypothetical protein DFH06DRAFT_1214606 [Mycena polygramma]